MSEASPRHKRSGTTGFQGEHNKAEATPAAIDAAALAWAPTPEAFMRASARFFPTTECVDPAKPTLPAFARGLIAEMMHVFAAPTYVSAARICIIARMIHVVAAPTVIPRRRMIIMREMLMFPPARTSKKRGFRSTRRP